MLTNTIPKPLSRPLRLMDENQSNFSSDSSIPDIPIEPNPSNQHSCRCKTSARSRNLVVCIDGTSNQFGARVMNSDHAVFTHAFTWSCRTRTSWSCTASSSRMKRSSPTIIVGLGLMRGHHGGRTLIASKSL